jgi:hypothetical protein
MGVLRSAALVAAALLAVPAHAGALDDDDDDDAIPRVPVSRVTWQTVFPFRGT